MLQLLFGIAHARGGLAARNGPPNGPAALRVSATRHGVTGMKVRPVGVCELKPMAHEPPPEFSQFDWIRYCLPLRTISACAPFKAGKVEEKSSAVVAVPYLKLHKSPFSPAVLRWNQALP